MMNKISIFLLADTYIDSFEAFISTLDIISIKFTDEYVFVTYK